MRCQGFQAIGRGQRADKVHTRRGQKRQKTEGHNAPRLRIQQNRNAAVQEVRIQEGRAAEGPRYVQGQARGRVRHGFEEVEHAGILRACLEGDEENTERQSNNVRRACEGAAYEGVPRRGRGVQAQPLRA